MGKWKMRICFLQKPSKNKMQTSDLAARNKKTGVIDTGHKILQNFLRRFVVTANKTLDLSNQKFAAKVIFFQRLSYDRSIGT